MSILSVPAQIEQAAPLANDATTLLYEALQTLDSSNKAPVLGREAITAIMSDAAEGLVFPLAATQVFFFNLLAVNLNTFLVIFSDLVCGLTFKWTILSKKEVICFLQQESSPVYWLHFPRSSSD